MVEPRGRVLVHQYFYKRLSEIDEEEREVIRAIRTKVALVPLCDKLRQLDIEKRVIMQVYDELKLLYW
ncbi:hypothetical protein LJC63_07920 [Ruminococcaceae bacterium OttesenSCG-928-L11]|nr:hypothetical protein [Ruminococcaceae bacterium OttesenSCG-928-L11]